MLQQVLPYIICTVFSQKDQFSSYSAYRFIADLVIASIKKLWPYATKRIVICKTWYCNKSICN